jgi:hypothetical protein
MQVWAHARLTKRQAAWLALQLAKRLSQSAKTTTRQIACGRGTWPGHRQHTESKRVARQAAVGLGARQQRAGTTGGLWPWARVAWGLAGWFSHRWTMQATSPLSRACTDPTCHLHPKRVT